MLKASLVFAQEEVVVQSRAHYDLGRVAHAAGRFAEACREFQEGYRLVPKPEFLINIGQCRRGLKQIREARESYAKFLRDAPNRHPRRREVQEIVAELDREIAALPPAAVEPAVDQKPAPPVEVAPPPAPTPAVATQPVVATQQVVQINPAPPPRSGIHKYWWLIPVSVVVAAGVAVGLGVGLTANSCPANTTCLNARD